MKVSSAHAQGYVQLGRGELDYIHYVHGMDASSWADWDGEAL